MRAFWLMASRTHRRAPAVAVALALVAALAAPAVSHAQCGATVSECRTCHEVRAAQPVLGGSAWHEDHAFGDFCALCHGGDPLAKEAALAHVGVAAPLATAGTVEAACGECHGAAAGRLARSYLAMVPRPSAAGVPQPGRQAAAPRRGNVLLAALVVLVGAGGGVAIVRNERRLAEERAR